MDGLDALHTTDGVLHDRFPGLVNALDWIGSGIDLLAIAVMLIGAGRFLVGFAAAEATREKAARARVINAERMELGRYILAGLELFIVSDIIHAALSLALGDLVFLGLLVAIRATISYFLDREIRQIREDPER